ncbi:LysR family transcriptional regulator [Methyloversatilis thermotolerans]|uniref:LysR family transcriptional regulator n=1 Tax=Methyloversatilis thermotolerans TaxID=1346290 RepID=UPI000475F533|nr:LysR family transcriptional regulator [Methyloversatilis thermotolerans]
MKALRDLEVFRQTADSGSLTDAARRLDITPAAASMAIKRLEEELGVRLFVRSTRSLRLTDEGQIYLTHCRQALQALDDGREAALAGSAAFSGVVHLSAPSDIGRNLMLHWLDDFLDQHPRLQLRLLLSDRPVDLYRQPVDLTLRYGPLPDSSLIALPVAPDNRRVLCASPAYIERHGRPDSPKALARHNCLCFMLDGYVHDRWTFHRDGGEMQVSVKGDRIADDGEAVRRWAVDGRGIAFKSEIDVATDLRAGRLVRLCTDWLGEMASLHLVCSDRRRVTPVVQSLREFLARRCAQRLAEAQVAPQQ